MDISMPGIDRAFYCAKQIRRFLHFIDYDSACGGPQSLGVRRRHSGRFKIVESEIGPIVERALKAEQRALTNLTSAG